MRAILDYHKKPNNIIHPHKKTFILFILTRNLVFYSCSQETRYHNHPHNKSVILFILTRNLLSYSSSQETRYLIHPHKKHVILFILTRNQISYSSSQGCKMSNILNIGIMNSRNEDKPNWRYDWWNSFRVHQIITNIW